MHRQGLLMRPSATLSSSFGKGADAAPCQINQAVVDVFDEGMIVEHCLPACHEHEITEESLKECAEEVSRHAEDGQHVQKAILVKLAGAR